MKTIILGNAGAGKSTLARQLAARASGPVAVLSLDAVAFVDGTSERRPLAASVAAAEAFIAAHETWIIEGCYADLVAPLCAHADELIFLNPGVAACVAHCRARPWERDKFPTREAQDEHLASLIAWVQAYATRDDEYGLRQHRAVFTAFTGTKRELTEPEDYAPV